MGKIIQSQYCALCVSSRCVSCGLNVCFGPFVPYIMAVKYVCQLQTDHHRAKQTVSRLCSGMYKTALMNKLVWLSEFYIRVAVNYRRGKDSCSLSRKTNPLCWIRILHNPTSDTTWYTMVWRKSRLSCHVNEDGIADWKLCSIENIKRSYYNIFSQYM